jgi:DNA-binding NarL/FixJ family response regulator
MVEPMASGRIRLSAPVTIVIDVDEGSVIDRLEAEANAGAAMPLHFVESSDIHCADIIVTMRRSGVRLPTILLSDNPIDLSLSAADPFLRAVLPTDVEAPELFAAVQAVAQGLAVLPVGLFQTLVDIFAAPTPDAYCAAALTSREREVLTLLADGGTNKHLARRLGVSVHTAKFHVSTLMAKLNARSRADLVAIGLRRGLIAL